MFSFRLHSATVRRHNDSVRFTRKQAICEINPVSFAKPLTVATYKRKWFDEVYAELRGSGLTDTTIASRMGYSRSYFSQVKVAENIGDEFIDKMSATFRKRFIPKQTASEDQQSVSADQKQLSEVAEELKALKHLVIALLDRVPPKP